jgi:hypothetical protein
LHRERAAVLRFNPQKKVAYRTVSPFWSYISIRKRHTQAVKGIDHLRLQNPILYNNSRIEPATAMAADGRKCTAAE